MLLRASLYLGMVLLLGAGLFPRWIAPGELSGPSRRLLRQGLVIGALLLALASLLEIPASVTRLVGSFDAELTQDYLLNTRHGHATLLRTILVMLVVVIGLGGLLPRVLDRLCHAALALGVLASVSWVSHSGVMGLLPFLGDWAHLIGATLWAGSVLYLAWLPLWAVQQRPQLLTAVQRVSSLGLISVIVLAVTGVYSGLLHVWGVAALTTTPYGWALVTKVSLVLVILALAGLNRWWLMPKLERQHDVSLRAMVRVESVLLAGVLIITGVLATRSPAHPPDAWLGRSQMAVKPALDRAVQTLAAKHAAVDGALTMALKRRMMNDTSTDC